MMWTEQLKIWVIVQGTNGQDIYTFQSQLSPWKVLLHTVVPANWLLLLIFHIMQSFNAFWTVTDWWRKTVSSLVRRFTHMNWNKLDHGGALYKDTWWDDQLWVCLNMWLRLWPQLLLLYYKYNTLWILMESKVVRNKQSNQIAANVKNLLTSTEWKCQEQLKLGYRFEQISFKTKVTKVLWHVRHHGKKRLG